MKKRILSMLLLVAMLVTALPLAVLPSLAATEEEKVYEEKDYNALYVSNGLAMGADFFKMNKYWNPEGEGHIDYVVPVAPFQKTATVVNGVEYDFSDADVRAANQQAYIDAVVAWKTEYKNYLNGFTWTTGNMKFGLFQDYSKGADIYTYANRFTTVVDAADGYMQFRSDYYGSGGMIFNNIPASTATTSQYVASYTDAGVGKTEVTFLFHNIRPRLTATADGVKLSGFSTSYFGGSTYADETDYVAPLNHPFTMTNSLALSSTAGEDAFSLRVGTATLVDLTGDYGKETLDINNCYIGWGTAQPWLRLYAFRHYDRVLSDAEIAQNHFADIAKWFRIDLSVLDVLSSADMALISDAFKDFTFESDKAVVEATLQSKVIELVAEKYAGTAAAAYAALAVKHGLDLSPLLSNPKGMLVGTYAFLNGVTDESVNVKAGYEAALALDLVSSMTAEQYNALYVWDGMVAGVDFYSTNQYWANKAETATTTADAKALLDGYRYDEGFVTFTNPNLAKDATLTVKDGYLDLAAITGEFQFSGVEKAMGYGVNGSSAELVRAIARNAVIPNINSLRVHMSVDGTVNTITNGSYDMYKGNAAVTASNKLGTPLAYKDFKNAHTYTVNMQRDAITEKSCELDYKAENFDAPYNKNNSQIFYYLNHDVYEIETAENGEVTVNLGKTIYTLDEHGINVADVKATKEDTLGVMRLISMRDYPARPVTPKYIKAADGTVTENTDGTIYWTAIERFVNGVATIYQDGAKLYHNDEMQFVNNAYYNGTDSYLVVWGYDAGQADNSGKLYAARYYNRNLTEAEIAQNHFADIAKFFKLNIVGYDTLDAAGRAAVHAAVADFTLDSDKTEVQTAVSAVLNAAAKATYDAMKAENPDIPASFFDLACDYRLDLSEVLAADANLSRLYALSFDGLSCADAQVLLDKTLSDILNFYVHEREGADDWNAWLSALVASGTVENIENLLVLPFDERVGIVAEENNTDPAVIAAYVEEMSAKYSIVLPEYDSYNALYVQDGIVMGADFFKMNRYWNLDGTVYTVPVGPSLNTAYSYDVDGDGTAEVYDLTDAANRAIVVSAAEDENNGKTLYEIARAEWKTAYPKWMNETFLWTSQTGMRFGVYDNKLDETKEFAPVDPADGYMQFRSDYITSGGIVFASIPAMTEATGQVVMEYSGTHRNGNVPVLFHNIRPSVTAAVGGVALSGFSTGYFGGSTHTDETDAIAPLNTAFTMTQSLSVVDDTEQVKDSYSIRIGDKTIVSLSGQYGNKTNQAIDQYNYYIGWGVTQPNLRMYAFREYSRVLSDAEILQNHFADLAKFYRLDLAGFNMMNDEQKAAAYEALRDFTLGSGDRNEIQAALNAEVAKLYAGIEIIEGNEADNAKFIKLAVAGTLELDAIKMLSPAARAEFAYGMLADFDPDYALNGAIVAHHYAARTELFEAMTFAGYQVRLDSGASFANYAGVRAIFDINEDAIAAILAKDENAGKAITLTTSMIGDETATLTFVYTLVDGALKCTTDAIVYERGGGKSVNYTATYKDDEFTKENLEREFSYAYTIALGDAAAIEFTVDTVTFGDKVSAAEVYGYFYANGFETDRMVAEVMAKLTK